jgi:bifunctional DNA-binding transcriptional regulator/antitoxin component of YhaV-PrlF toxin-antitoxin module
MEAIKEYKFIAKVVGGGKVTIPLEVRNVMGISDGMHVEMLVKIVPKSNGT